MSDGNGAFSEQQSIALMSSTEMTFPTLLNDGRWIIGYDNDNWEPIYLNNEEQLASVVAAGGEQKSEETQTTFENVLNDASCFSIEKDTEKNGKVHTCENDPSAAVFDWNPIDESLKQEGVVGLTNLGNTCFINSGLQCLFNNWRLVDFFSEYKLTAEKGECALAKSYISLHQNVWSKERKEKVIKNSEFKDALGQRFIQFKDYRQHDCQEFLALLLSGLHDDLKEEQPSNEAEELQSIEEEKSTISSPSSVSSCSSDNHHEDEIRKQPLPDTIKSFKIPPSLVKETKTANTNVMKEDDERNNQLNFNSVKYPMIRRKDQFVDNLSNEHLFDDETSLKGCKRIKQTNLEIHRNGLTVTRSTSSSHLSPSCSTANEELNEAITTTSTSLSCPITSHKRQKVNEDEGSMEWRQYLGYNKTSVIVDTFQGQFKSTIKCSNCHHISVTYEPFMYLALPIPNALEKQVVVTFVNSVNFSYCYRDVKPIKYLLNLHKYGNVSKLVEKLSAQLKKDGIFKDFFQVIVADVQDKYINRILDQDTCVRHIDDKCIYAYAVTSSLATATTSNSSKQQTPNWHFDSTSTPKKVVCNICLDEKSTHEILIHDPKCNCKLCLPCLQNVIAHYCKDTDKFSCPICSEMLSEDRFYALESESSTSSVTPRSMQIPLLFRVDQLQSDLNAKYKLLSFPLVIEVMNVMNSSQLYDIVNRLVPYLCPYSLRFVSRDGQRCSRCFWTSDCEGCEISRYSDVAINYDDSIAVEFESSEFSVCDDLEEQIVEHSSMSLLKEKSTQSTCLSLNDCLTEFSQSEVLDEENPWYCPICLSNQRANKSLSIWRCPDTLMVYLKRFIFYEMQSIKVDDPICFPIDKLDMSPFVKGPGGGHIYTLQSFVCHSGGVNSGHYTSFSKNCSTNEWLYFNDETVTKQEPSDKDDRAYILFYQRPKEETKTIKSTNNHLKKVINDEKCNGISEEMIIA